MKSHVTEVGQLVEAGKYRFGLKKSLGEVFESSGKDAGEVVAALAAKLTYNWVTESTIAAFNCFLSFLSALGNTGTVKGTAFSTADILAKDDGPMTMLMLTRSDSIISASRMIAETGVPMTIAKVPTEAEKPCSLSLESLKPCSVTMEFLHGRSTPLLIVNMVDTDVMEMACYSRWSSPLRAFMSEELLCGGHDDESVQRMVNFSLMMQEVASMGHLWPDDVSLAVAHEVPSEVYKDSAGSVTESGLGGKADTSREIFSAGLRKLLLAKMQRKRIKEKHFFRVAGMARKILAWYG